MDMLPLNYLYITLDSRGIHGMSCRIGPIQCLLVYVTLLLATFGYGMSINTSAEFQMQASPLLTASYKVWESQ